MRLTFLGAAGEVTGSSYLVETGSTRVLVDCGLYQGLGATRERNADFGRLDPSRLDSVVLTHAHLDHSGRLPLLVSRGFHKYVFATAATADLARVILEDAARIQQSDAERSSRRRQRAGRPTVAPLYTVADVERLDGRFRTLAYGESHEVAENVQVRLFDAGHILGSASVVMTVTEANSRRVVVFSGDVGMKGAPFLRDPEPPPPAADLVVMESTYGDRDHRPRAETVESFRAILTEAVARREKVLVPSFAVGRTQEILYVVAELRRTGALPNFPVYVDSPMAIEAMRLYERYSSLFDEETRALGGSRGVFHGLAGLRCTATAAESKAINEQPGMALVIAGSGMCDGGRILHHLRHNLWRPEVSVVIVGYQAEGTLGRRLVAGARSVRIFGESVAVRASVHTLGGFSAHAGQPELLDWAGAVAPSRPGFVLTHGEPHARDALRDALYARFGLEPECPDLGDSVQLD